MFIFKNIIEKEKKYTCVIDIKSIIFLKILFKQK